VPEDVASVDLSDFADSGISKLPIFKRRIRFSPSGHHDSKEFKSKRATHQRVAFFVWWLFPGHPGWRRQAAAVALPGE